MNILFPMTTLCMYFHYKSIRPKQQYFMKCLAQWPSDFRHYNAQGRLHQQRVNSV